MKYDVIIIGGGVVGLSVAYQLSLTHPQMRIAVLEKENTLAQHQTGHNSGVIHAGVYYTPGSLKAKFCLTGNKATQVFCQEHNIPYKILGKLVVATDELELQRMQNLIQRCQQNGLSFEVLDEKATQEAQPGMLGVGAIFVKDTGIVDWKVVSQKYAELFKRDGGEIYCHEKITSITEGHSTVIVKTNQNHVYEAAYVITCAGLYADQIVKMSGLQPEFKIIPFRGEYYRLSDHYASTFKHLIYPVPDPNLPFLGVHFTPQIHGFTTIGPNAVLALAREGYSWKHINLREAFEIVSYLPTWKSICTNFSATVNELRSSLFKSYYLKRAQKYFPNIKIEELLPYPAGVRAQAINKQGKLIEDFLFMQTQRILHTCNAPSPAATSSLPIGKYILEKFNEILR